MCTSCVPDQWKPFYLPFQLFSYLYEQQNYRKYAKLFCANVKYLNLSLTYVWCCFVGWIMKAQRNQVIGISKRLNLTSRILSTELKNYHGWVPRHCYGNQPGNKCGM